MTLRQVRRIAAYGVCRDEADRVLLVCTPMPSGGPGVPGGDDSGRSTAAWNLPGGGIAHGEDPAVTVVREFREEAGLPVEVLGVRSVSMEVTEFAELGILCHCDQVVYDVRPVGASVVDGSPAVAWWKEEEVAGLPLYERVRQALGVEGLPELILREPAGGLEVFEPDPNRGQRFSAYGVVTDPSDRILLTLIADNYPGAGTWHLPGGGTDFGEEANAGLLREITEETGQTGRVLGLMGVTNMHNPVARGPEGRPMDWHGVRVTYRVLVDDPTSPVVGEVDGSTADAGWFTSVEAKGLRLNRPAAGALMQAGVV